MSDRTSPIYRKQLLAATILLETFGEISASTSTVELDRQPAGTESFLFMAYKESLKSKPKGFVERKLRKMGR